MPTDIETGDPFPTTASTIASRACLCTITICTHMFHCNKSEGNYNQYFNTV